MRAAVERANSAAVWGAALRSGDPAPLTTVWEGDALTYFSGEVRMYEARGLRLLSTPLLLDVVAVEVPGDGSATAATHERWLDRLCTADGELRAERQAEVRDRYKLDWHDDAWWIRGVDVELIAGSFDWTPAQDPADDPFPCASVVN